MNTPAHVIINLVVQGKREQPKLAVPIVIGAALPDITMILFYAYEKLILGTPEKLIWSEKFAAPIWQALFDIGHSIPLALAAFCIAHRLGAAWWANLFASMGLHGVFDFPLHHEGAHRHFYPLWDWRFNSPVSYWNPEHYGHIVSTIEILLVIVGGIFLARRYESVAVRAVLGVVIGVYALYHGFVLWMWA